MKKRSAYDIYADVLKVVKALGYASITKISYGAELPVDRAKKAVNVLLRAGLLEKRVKGGRVFYTVTGRGLEYLEIYFKLKEYLKNVEKSTSNQY
ncbi:MAG: hypothetical protein DRJ52_07780 [Thermoprotei archaeon]|nr:MAG: hypothetical protein DRJ52_07780 [Thermoprotei archaeon]RLE99242.1 MAG: hypothetical protein DRJ63_05985 [Thermoprotei archaeon]